MDGGVLIVRLLHWCSKTKLRRKAESKGASRRSKQCCSHLPSARMIGSYDAASRDFPARELDSRGITWSVQWKAFRSDIEKWEFESQKR